MTSSRVGISSGPQVISAAALTRCLGLRHEPTAEQSAVIESPLAPALVVAGAGSGKTQTMALRVCWLVANGVVAPERILGLTFTRKAAAELAERVRGLLAKLGVCPPARLAPDGLTMGPTVSTYHAYAGRIFAEHALRSGREPGSRLLGAAACWQFATAVVDTYDGPMDLVPWAPSTVTSAVLELSGDLAEHLVEPSAVRTYLSALRAGVSALPRGAARSRNPYPKDMTGMLAGLAAREQLLPLVERYQAAKRAADAVDFGDQVALAAQMAREHPDVGQLERERFGAVLLDEYQDTGHAQRCLLQALFGGGHPVAAVGDPCQSIYGWRGASAGNLTRFSQDFADSLGPARTFALTTSFRNGSRILDVANVVSAPLRARGIPVAVLCPVPGAPSGRVVTAMHLTEADEAGWLADRIADLIEPPSPMTTHSAAEPVLRSFAPGEVAILVRRRSQMKPLARALADRGVAVEVAGLGGLLGTSEVTDVVSVLRILADDRSSPALMRLLTGPRWRMGPRDLLALGRRARQLAGPARDVAPNDDDMPADLVEALEDPGAASGYSPAAWERMSRLRGELRMLRRRTAQPLPDLVSVIIQTLRLDVEIVAAGTSGQQGSAHLEAFLDVAASFAEEGPSASLPAFCSWLDAAEKEERGLERGQLEDRPDAVSIVTAHSAKGLEWAVVAVAGLADGIFPNRSQASSTWARNTTSLPFPLRGDAADLPPLALEGCRDHKDVEDAITALRDSCAERELLEERRLAYVAMTRAKELLLLSGHRWGTATKPRADSPFLSELEPLRDAGLVEVDCWTPEPGEGETNPTAGDPARHVWPFDPLPPQRRAALEEAAGLVREAAKRLREAPAGLVGESEPAPDDAQVKAWRDEVGRLLAEREVATRTSEVLLPDQLSVSDLAELDRDPGALALRLRRPMPVGPAPVARRGTALHAWLERRFASPTLFDLDDLAGSADEVVLDDDLDGLREAFLTGSFGQRVPVEVEVPFETMIDGTLVRGRMDAVFRDDDGRWDVIDWKTGQRPQGHAARWAAVQLAAYRVAWAALQGVDPAQVRAGFHYVLDDSTVRPAELMDRDGLARLIRSAAVVASPHRVAR